VPFWDREMLAQNFDVRDQMPGRVVNGTGVWTGFSAAALVEEYHPVSFWIEKLRVGLADVAAGAAVEVDY
jgi:hypothetical protein